MNFKNFFTQHWQYLTLKTACKLDIFDLIETKNCTTIDDFQQKGFHKYTVTQLLNVLTDLGLIVQEQNTLKLTPTGGLFTETHPKTLKYSAIIWAEEHLTAWQNLEHTVKTGKPVFEKIYGTKFFDFLAQNPEKLKIYHRAMGEYARDDYENICKIIDFTTHKSIMDVGGGLGALISVVKKNHPEKTCFLFEKQEVINIAQTPDISTIAGNFFIEIPRVADTIIMSRILHDWEDNDCHKILENVHKALPDNGTLYVIENLQDKTNDNLALLNLNMVLMTNSFERDFKSYKQLLSATGFKIAGTKQLNALQWIIIAKKT